MMVKWPWLMFALTFLSGGVLVFVWLVLLMRDINELEGQRIFRTDLVAAVIIIAQAAVLLFFIYEIRMQGFPGGPPVYPFLVAIVVVIGLFALYLGSVVAVARRIAWARGRQFGLVDAFITMILTIYLLSFPILQSRINRLRDSPAQIS